MKGTVELAAMAILSFLLALGLLSFTTDTQNYVKDQFREKTTDLIANRVAGDIYAIGSYPHGGKMEVRLRDEYRFSIDDGKVNISYKDVWATSEFTSDHSIKTEKENTDTNRICILNQGSEITVKGESC